MTATDKPNPHHRRPCLHGTADSFLCSFCSAFFLFFCRDSFCSAGDLEPVFNQIAPDNQAVPPCNPRPPLGLVTTRDAGLVLDRAEQNAMPCACRTHRHLPTHAYNRPCSAGAVCTSYYTHVSYVRSGFWRSGTGGEQSLASRGDTLRSA